MGALMIQGAGSNVGKSMIVAGLCRAARLRGLSVAPFKQQNMSNNAAVTVDGGEIGRAQALQAMACGLEPVVDMNPVLLKPETETGAQVVVQGRRVATVRARDYAALKPSLMAPVLESFGRLRAAYDLVIVEGAGSPAEVNLRAGDIANMGFAVAADVPVVLVGDIDRGGGIAQIVGTQAVLEARDNARIAGFLINKFRGDPRLFDDGYRLIEARTGWRGFGVLPYFAGAGRLPAEDALDIGADTKGGRVKIVCLCLSRMANFDDLDPLKVEPGVSLVMLRAGQPMPGDASLVIIPGSKSTRGDLAFLRAQGWDIDLAAHVRRGGQVLGICGGYQMLGRVVRDPEGFGGAAGGELVWPAWGGGGGQVLGICGGYQMLGRVVRDPEGFEGAAGADEGLGLLDVETVMSAEKRLTRVAAVHAASGLALQGYEIHIGRTEGADCARPFARVDGLDEGAISRDGRVTGSYLHGLFSDDAFRAAYLAGLGVQGAGVEAALDELAAHL